MGIDVGEIDATLHLGFPGSIARYFPSCFNIHDLLNIFNSFICVDLCTLNQLHFSLWQQAGRGGRRDKPSLAVYVAFGGPLDQYFMRHPNKLFGRPIECCHVDSQNKKVL